MDTMTDADVASALRVSARTARRYIAAWVASQANPIVPRVTTVRSAGRGRPRHEVQRESFVKWTLSAP